MSGYAYSPAQLSPSRPGHRLNRSITEVSPPTRKAHPHRSHHLHQSHPHHISTKRARSSDKERNRDAEPQSAHPNLQPFLASEARWRGGVKSEFGTPAESRDASRRQSVVVNGDAAANSTPDGSIHGYRRVVTEKELKEEKEKGALRAKELRTALLTLHTQSNDATRKLDVTYYSVLEKMSILQASISSLKEVAALTRTINNDFQAESADLRTEVSSQLENFSNFSSQESRIQDLAQRVQLGRTKMTSLGRRVDVVRKRVEGWERAELAWQEKTRRRLRVMWIIMSVAATLLLGLIVFRYTPARAQGPAVLHGFNHSDFPGLVPGTEEFTFSLQRERQEGESMLERLRKAQAAKEEDDQILRELDEL